jgi:PPOX class probable F420-dependent enzyme
VRLDQEVCRQRGSVARVARLATAGGDGVPHLVPVTFAVRDDMVVVVVDDKPKVSRDLQRLRNIAVNPAVAFLVDEYSDDWAALWWVRIDARLG